MDVVDGSSLVDGRQSWVITYLRRVKLLARPPLLVGQIGDRKIELIKLPDVFGQKIEDHPWPK